MPELRRRFSSLFVFSGLAMVAGFATQMLVAYHFGTSARLDAYWLALAVANAMGFYVHPLRESLISVVYGAAKSHTDQASEVLTAGVLLLLACSCVAAIGLGLIAYFGWLTPAGFNKIQFSNLLFIFLPFVFLFALSEMFNAVLLSFDLALHQAWARLLSALCALVSLGLLGGWLGIYAMVVSLLVGQLIVLVVSWRTLYVRNLRWRNAGLAPLRNRAFISMFGSLLLNYLLAQSYVFAERWIMSALQPGLLSAFQYATLLVNVMISMLALPLSNLLWPRFLELEGAGDRSRIPALAWSVSAPVIFLLLALATFTWRAAPEVVSLVFERGRFDASSHQQTVAALRLTVFASVPIGLVTVALRALMSQGRSTQVASVGILMALIGMSVLGGAWLLRSISSAQAHWVVANGCGALLAWLLLLREAPVATVLGLRILRVAVLSVVSVGLPLIILPDINFGRMPWQLALSLLGESLIYGSIVLVLSLIFRLTDLNWFLLRLRMQ